MIGWLEDAAAALAGGPDEPCPHHDHHAVKVVPVRLGGQLLLDWPPVLAHRSCCFDLAVFDAALYEGVNDAGRGYCTGDDEVSRSVLLHGGWEGWETVTALDLLGVPVGGVVVDVGAHVGWYSLLAASAGRTVLAVEASPEVAGVCAANADANRLGDLVTVVRGFVGADTEPVPAGQRIRLLKVDIEGLEWEAARVFEPSLRAGDVDFALVELTPIFAVSRWRDVVDLFASCGYDAYLIPGKAWPDPRGYARDVAGVLRSRPFDPAVPFDQENVLFARRGLL